MVNNYRKNFTTNLIMPLSILNHPNLSLAAKGLWAFLNSKPEDWKLSAENMANELPDAEEDIRKLLNELVRNGLIQVQQTTKGAYLYSLNLPRVKKYNLNH